MTDSTISSIINELDLEDYLDSEGVDYKRVGGGDNLNLRECPFCGDTRSKVYFHRVKKRGLCFHGDCDARFNVYSFTKALLACDDAGVRTHLRSYASGSSAPRPITIKPVIVQSEWDLPDNISLPTEEGYSHPYLLDRHITLDTQKLYDLRWCEKGKWLYKDNFGASKEMRYDNRIIIPIYDIDGSLKSFVGRDVTNKSDKRYLFPATLPATGRFLYGANLVTDQTDLIIGEGTFDVYGIHQSIVNIPDFKHCAAIGSFGLSIGMNGDENDDQFHRLLILKDKGVKNIIFMWDGSKAAFTAAVNNGLKISQQGFNVKIATLPIDKDPNEVDTSTVRKCIVDAKPLDRMNAMLWTINSPY